MSDRKSWLALVVGVGLVLHGCAWMSNRTRTENAAIAAAACGIPAAFAGGWVAHNNDANTHMRVPAGAAAGLFGGALICGGLAYLLTPEPPPPAPKPAPPPPPHRRHHRHHRHQNQRHRRHLRHRHRRRRLSGRSSWMTCCLTSTRARSSPKRRRFSTGWLRS